MWDEWHSRSELVTRLERAVSSLCSVQVSGRMCVSDSLPDGLLLSGGRSLAKPFNLIAG